jgi:hypothetical protein
VPHAATREPLVSHSVKQAALLFVRPEWVLQITAAIAHRGAHVLSRQRVPRTVAANYSSTRRGRDQVCGRRDYCRLGGDEQELKSTSCVPPGALELQQKAGEHAATVRNTVPHPLWTVLRSTRSEIFEAPSTQICNDSTIPWVEKVWKDWRLGGSFQAGGVYRITASTLEDMGVYQYIG